MVFVFMKSSYENGDKQGDSKRFLKVTFFSVTVLLVYTLVGAALFSALNPEYTSQGSSYGELKNTTFLDATYFIVVTLTTVGFGDIAPSNDATKLFLSVYILLSLLLVGALLEMTNFLFSLDIEQQLEEDSEEESSSAHVTRARKKLFVAVLIVFFAIGISTLFFTLYEEFSVVDAFYFSVSTLSTVGYGDITPKTQEGLVFCIVWIATGCMTLFRAVGALMEVMLESRKRAWKRARHSRASVIRNHISSRVGNLSMINVDEEKALEKIPKSELVHVLTKMEFILYRLIKMEKVDDEELRDLDREYKALSPEKIKAEFESSDVKAVFAQIQSPV